MNFSQGIPAPSAFACAALRRCGFPQAEIQENYRSLAKSWSNNHPAEPSSVRWGQSGNAPKPRHEQGIPEHVALTIFALDFFHLGLHK